MNGSPFLTCVFFPDLMPWEKQYLRSVCELFASQHPVRTLELTRQALKGKAPLLSPSEEGPIWILAHDWRGALERLRPSKRATVFVSVLGTAASPGALATLFLKRFRSRLPESFRL